MFKRLMKFIERVSQERNLMLDWTFNRFIWKPPFIKIEPRAIEKELSVQPMFTHVPTLPLLAPIVLKGKI